jgi:hypothetical protein
MLDEREEGQEAEEGTQENQESEEESRESDDEVQVPITELRKVRAEAASRRKENEALQDRLAKLEEEKKTADRAKLSKQERLEVENAELKQKYDAERQARINESVNSAVINAASAAGFREPQDALGLVDKSTIPVSETGRVDTEEVEAIVKGIAERKSYLLRGEDEQDLSAMNFGSTKNPPPQGAFPTLKPRAVKEIEALKAGASEAFNNKDPVKGVRLINEKFEAERRLGFMNDPQARNPKGG